MIYIYQVEDISDVEADLPSEYDPSTWPKSLPTPKALAHNAATQLRLQALLLSYIQKSHFAKDFSMSEAESIIRTNPLPDCPLFVSDSPNSTFASFTHSHAYPSSPDPLMTSSQQFFSHIILSPIA